MRPANPEQNDWTDWRNAAVARLDEIAQANADRWVARWVHRDWQDEVAGSAYLEVTPATVPDALAYGGEADWTVRLSDHRACNGRSSDADFHLTFEMQAEAATWHLIEEAFAAEPEIEE